MNKQDKNIEIFSRMANYVVVHYVNKAKGSASYEYLQELINNAQMINQILIASAIRMVNKVKHQKDTDVDMLVEQLKNVIHNSVSKYTSSYN